MIAIEKTCLEHFKYKITHQSNDLKAEDILKILSNPISVKEWTSNNKLLLYFQITTIIFYNGQLEEFYQYLYHCDQKSNLPDYYPEMLYDSVMSRYFEFYQRIYLIYQLNRLYYVLRKFSYQEINKLNLSEIICQMSSAQETTFNADKFLSLVLYELPALNTCQDQTNDMLWFKIDRRLYFLKVYYLRIIKTLIQEPNYQQKFQSLKKKLRTIKPNDIAYPFASSLKTMITKNFRINKKPTTAKENFQYRLLP